jgi:RNA polymerase sigma factor (sigma-70 family)
LPQLDRETLDRLQTGLRIMALQELGDPVASEEVVQETIARVLSALHDDRLGDPAKLAAYAHGVARHVIVDEYRSRARSSSFQSRLGHQTSDPPGALDKLISAEERTRLRFALRGLGGRDRKILRLSYEEGLSCAEIARRQTEPADRIRKRKSRAVQRLREAFFTESHTPPAKPTSPMDADVSSEERHQGSEASEHGTG